MTRRRGDPPKSEVNALNNKKIISVIAVILAILMLITLVVGILPASVFAASFILQRSITSAARASGKR